MENNKKFSYINVLILILSAFAIALRLSKFKQLNTLGKVDAIICVVGLLFGFAYTLSGFIKESAKLYKVFIVFYSINCLFSIYNYCSQALIRTSFIGVKPILLVGHIFVAILAIILAFIKDLGKQKSYKLSYSLLIISAIMFASTVIADSNNVEIGLSNLVLALLEVVFIYAKYTDKQSRGTK